MTEIEGIFMAFLGEDAVAELGKVQFWDHFHPFDEHIMEMKQDALSAIERGNTDVKTLTELSQKFDFYAQTFLQRILLGTDQSNKPVTFAMVFGGNVNCPRPELALYLAAKFLGLFVAQKRYNQLLLEKLGKEVKFEAIELKFKQ